MHRITRRAVIAACATLALATAAHAQDKTFKLALQNPKGHPLVTGAERFAEAIEMAWRVRRGTAAALDARRVGRA